MIHIITAVHNRYEITEKFIDCLNSQTYKNMHLLLIDDGSTDGTAEMVKKKFNNVTIIKGDGNLWWGGALHEAYKWIRDNRSDHTGEAILFSNDDVIYAANYIKKGLKHLREVKHGMVLGEGYSFETGELIDTVQVFDFDNTDWREGALVRSDNRVGECSSTRSLFLRVGTFLRVGGFHPILLPHYGSDYEWTIRAARKGYLIHTFDDLNYSFSVKTTGEKDYSNLTLKKLFSKRSVSNPIYNVSYILLAMPWGYKVKGLMAQGRRWVGHIRNIVERRYL